MTQNSSCHLNHTHIKIGYIFDCRISGLSKDAPNFKFLGKLLQTLHICRFSEYDDHWIYDKQMGDSV